MNEPNPDRSDSLWRGHLWPFLLRVAGLGVGALVGDFLLHRLDLVWVGRYLGIPGTLLILASFVYSARKRGWLAHGNPATLLKLHQALAWLGSLLVLIHAGVHFNALLPWLATVAMGINVISGLVGRSLLQEARRYLQSRRAASLAAGQTASDIEHALYWDALTVQALTRWRLVHLPIFVIFAVLAVVHILSIFVFWGWA